MKQIFPTHKTLRTLRVGDCFLTSYEQKSVCASLYRIGLRCKQQFYVLTDPKHPELSRKINLVTITEVGIK